MISTLLQSDPDSTVEAVSNLDVVLRIGLAAILGMVVGYERKIADKPLGSRTMALIAAGAAGFALMGVEMASQVEFRQGLQLDPTRVLSYIITGVGFLGAASIWKGTRPSVSDDPNSAPAPEVHGLTTATSVWLSSAVGILCGGALYAASGGSLMAPVLASLGVLGARGEGVKGE